MTGDVKNISSSPKIHVLGRKRRQSKGSHEYIKREYNDIDWLRASRRVAPVEQFMNFTKERRHSTWLEKLLSLIKRLI